MSGVPTGAETLNSSAEQILLPFPPKVLGDRLPSARSSPSVQNAPSKLPYLSNSLLSGLATGRAFHSNCSEFYLRQGLSLRQYFTPWIEPCTCRSSIIARYQVWTTSSTRFKAFYKHLDIVLSLEVPNVRFGLNHLFCKFFPSR